MLHSISPILKEAPGTTSSLDILQKMFYTNDPLLQVLIYRMVVTFEEMHVLSRWPLTELDVAETIALPYAVLQAVSGLIVDMDSAISPANQDNKVRAIFMKHIDLPSANTHDLSQILSDLPLRRMVHACQMHHSWSSLAVDFPKRRDFIGTIQYLNLRQLISSEIIPFDEQGNAELLRTVRHQLVRRFLKVVSTACLFYAQVLDRSMLLESSYMNMLAYRV